MFIRYLAVFLWLALPGLAGAELLQYRYTDTQGQVKEQPPAQRFGNPAGGEVAIALSGGLDRRLRVELWRGSRLVTAAESEVLGSADRITVAGRDYYGAWLRMPAPPEGDYQVKGLLQDLAGNTVQTDTYSWTVDTPRYADARVMGAVAAMVIPDNVASYAYHQCLFMLGQRGETMQILNDAQLQPRTW